MLVRLSAAAGFHPNIRWYRTTSVQVQSTRCFPVCILCWSGSAILKKASMTMAKTNARSCPSCLRAYGQRSSIDRCCKLLPGLQRRSVSIGKRTTMALSSISRSSTTCSELLMGLSRRQDTRAESDARHNSKQFDLRSGGLSRTYAAALPNEYPERMSGHSQHERQARVMNANVRPSIDRAGSGENENDHCR